MKKIIKIDKTKKIVSILLLITLLFSFANSNKVYASDDDTGLDAGGILLKPLFALVNLVADSIMGLTDSLMRGQFGDILLMKNYDDVKYTGSEDANFTTSIACAFEGASRSRNTCY